MVACMLPTRYSSGMRFNDDVERAGWFHVYAASLTNDQSEREAEADAAVEASRRRLARRQLPDPDPDPETIYLDGEDEAWGIQR